MKNILKLRMGYLSLFRVVFNYYIFADCAFFGLLVFILF